MGVGREAAGDELALRRELHVHGTGGESFAEGVASTLPNAVNLFGGRTQNDAQGVVAEEELAGEGPELAAGLIEPEARYRPSHLDVREAHRRGYELFHAFAFKVYPRVAVGLYGFFEVLRERIPIVARRVAEEASGLQVLE